MPVKDNIRNIQVRRCLDGSVDAACQLDSAVILHINTAFPVLKHTLKRLIVFRCYMCGHRHFVQDYDKDWNGNPRKLGGGGTFCVYGWWWCVHNFFKHVRVALTMGDD